MKKAKIILSLMLIFIIALTINVNAAVGSFSLSKTSVTLKEGKTATFNIETKNCEGKFSVTSSNTSVVKVSSSSVWAPGDDATITITALKAGTAKITVTAVNVGDTDENDVTGSQTISVTVEADNQTNNGGSNNNATTNTGSNNAATNNNTGGNNSTTNTNTNTGSNSGTNNKPVTKSTNANLTTLGVRISESDAKKLGVKTNAYDFSGFKKSTTTYNVTVPYDIDSLKVSYKAADGATAKVTGDSGFEVGSNNKITIKVTAEDGKTTKTYTIKVTKLAEEEEKPGNIIDEEIEGLYLTSLSINGIEISPEFEKETYAYTATLEDTDLTEVEVKAEANKENASIEISGNTNLVVGENTINIVVKQEGSSAQAVYQIALKKVAELTTTTDIQDTNFMSSLIDNIKNYVIIAVAVVVLIIVVIITLIVLLRKENKKLREETNEKYNVYENDENEFESNKEEIVKETIIEETTNETETKNERRTRRKEKGRHSK